MSTPSERIRDLMLLFDPMKDWEAKYLKLIEMGKALPAMGDEFKTEEAKVKGCQSQVWLHAWRDDKGHVQLQGDSDAVLVKGLVALLVVVYSDASPRDIIETPPDFLETLGFKSHLSPSRANGLYAMIKQIRLFAMAYHMMDQAAGKA